MYLSLVLWYDTSCWIKIVEKKLVPIEEKKFTRDHSMTQRSGSGYIQIIAN